MLLFKLDTLNTTKKVIIESSHNSGGFRDDGN